MNKDSSIADILFPGQSLDCDIMGARVSSVVRLDNEFVLTLAGGCGEWVGVDRYSQQEVKNSGSDEIVIVFGYMEQDDTTVRASDTTDEALTRWWGEDTPLRLVSTPGQPFVLYEDNERGVCIPRS